MRLLRTVSELDAALEPERANKTIGLVPTMGAFHEGHLSLFRAARAECDVVVASLFVNAAQFAPAEDFARYPRDEQRDARLARGERVDYLFAPDARELYPPDYETWVDVERAARVLEGEHRPGHFRGVATVCLKLFNLVRPHRAYFGQKDAQQAAIVKQMVADLHVPVEIRVLPTVRDGDGLALSSRNAYLSEEERAVALVLPRALEAGAEAHRSGRDAAAAARAVLAAEPQLRADYVDIARLDGQLVLAAAARVGSTRLVDNVVLDADPA